MSDILVTSPFKPFTLPTQFKAVFNGFIYCGTVDAVDPSVSQVQVYLVNEAGDKVPVAQPLRTNAGGYLVYNGQPAKFVTDSNHSLLVADAQQVQQWYLPNVSVFDPQSFIEELAGPDGVDLVGNAADKRGEDFTGPISAPGIKSTSHYGDVIVGDNPIGNPGDDWPSSASLRDAINVSRKILNEPTDCHGFADKTVIDTPSDLGTYGSFDSTVILRGANTQDHVAGFQSRTDYAGSGAVDNSWGLLVWPTASGTSTIDINIGAYIKNVETATAVVSRNRGVDVIPLVTTDENIGVNVRTGDCISSPPKSFVSEQTGNGYSFYAHYLGAFYNKGKSFIGDFGIDNPAVMVGTSTFNVIGPGSTVVGFIETTNTDGAIFGAVGDKRVTFVGNAALLGYWGDVSDSRGFIAATSAAPLGTLAKRWNTAYLVTAPNVSSDERLKDFSDISAAEIACAKEVKGLLRKYKLKQDGDGGRLHFGVSAQQVVAAFNNHGLDPRLYNIVSVDGEGMHSIAYEELLAFIIIGL